MTEHVQCRCEIVETSPPPPPPASPYDGLTLGQAIVTVGAAIVVGVIAEALFGDD